LDCNEVLEKLGDYLDQSAREDLCKAIEAHLDLCRDCRFEVDTLNKTIKLYQAAEPIVMPVTVRSSLQAALAKAYEGPGIGD
jgi:predicted anti-sigma-YlaC factor YlaD